MQHRCSTVTAKSELAVSLGQEIPSWSKTNGIAKFAGEAQPPGVEHHTVTAKFELAVPPGARPVPTAQQSQSLLVELDILESQSTVSGQNPFSQSLLVEPVWSRAHGTTSADVTKVARSAGEKISCWECVAARMREQREAIDVPQDFRATVCCSAFGSVSGRGPGKFGLQGEE